MKIEKSMNKTFNLATIIMWKKPEYTVDHKNKVWYTDFTYICQPNGRFRYNKELGITFRSGTAICFLKVCYVL